jgi:FAD/FMN-containing dehydrogenase/Fe-S oxidoreductase
MLPRITPEATVNSHYATYLDALQQTSFQGDIRVDYAARLAVATDNSIYQVIPAAVLTPRSTADIMTALSLADTEAFRHHITFAPRGGGTGTNGQSLSAGIIMDCSQHMRDILELNIEQGWVRVQPGVVLDQLNQYLQPYGYYFAPQVSTSSRATLGGMINTDACGNGSRVLGRTSDHVLSLTCILPDGSCLDSTQPTDTIEKTITAIAQKNQALIHEKFTNAPRTLTGYNLLKGYQGRVNLTYILAGSEGTLGIVSECKLKITPIPKHKKLVLIKYACFEDALHAESLQALNPLVIETIDNTLLSLARQDSIYHHLKIILDGDGTLPQSINLVEFCGDDEKALAANIVTLCQTIDAHKTESQQPIGYYVANNPAEIKLLWELRKKSVGLISKAVVGKRRPIPFIEDTAVPPARLPDYIREFKALLDSYGLTYGMYGHVDAGCIHIRPALDLQQAADEKIMRELSDKVVALLEKYHGVMWGEHGRGFRSCYTEDFFGPELYLALREIKTLFDPHNRLNPGKIVTPLASSAAIVSLSGPLRAHYDKQIPLAEQNTYADAIVCNGNGACFNQATQETLCPSYKITKDRIHSPKGRAAAVREWLRQLAMQEYDVASMATNSVFWRRLVNSLRRKSDFSHEVQAAMAGCLGCKACATQCPLQVNIPEMKATFYSHYYQRYLRPLRDHALASLENVNAWLIRWPRCSNLLLQNPVSRLINRYLLKLVAVPHFSTATLQQGLRQRQARRADIISLQSLSLPEKQRSVILLQDTFTTCYEANLPLDAYDFFTALGMTVYVAPLFPNGKALQVKGFLARFQQLVSKNSAYLQQLTALDIPLIGIDPSITLTYRDEYPRVTGITLNVQLPQEWLSKKRHDLSIQSKTHPDSYFLLSHCTEKTACVAAEEQWQDVFAAFGLTLKPLAAGCCGMAGSFGHEAEHAAESAALFDLDWQKHLSTQPNDHILATGYSCRSQAKRLADAKLMHPLSALLKHLRSTNIT